MPDHSRLAEARYRARLAVGRRPLMFPLLKLLPRVDSRFMVDRHSDVCIEGYPRSGNSFACRSFLYWNPQVRIAHHLHAPMQVKRSAALGTPTAVIIRRPSEAVASLSVYFRGNISDDLLLAAYIDFYESIDELRNSIAICDFDTVIADPTVMIKSLNEKTQRNFAVGQWSAEAESHIRKVVTDIHNTKRGGLESRLSLPHDTKDIAKLNVTRRIEEHRLFERAEEVHTRFLDS